MFDIGHGRRYLRMFNVLRNSNLHISVSCRRGARNGVRGQKKDCRETLTLMKSSSATSGSTYLQKP